jgi:hypothetical protein
MRKRLAAATPRPIKLAVRAVIRATRRLFVCARYARAPAKRPTFELAVCAIFRDEASYLAEWVTFHRLQGVEHFWLYNNLSTDDWRSSLAPEIGSGLVSVTPWPREPGQSSAYADCLRRHRTEAQWIAFIDIDEFLFSPTGRPLPDVMREFDGHPGVAVNWRMYGVNGYQEAPEGLVVENYRMRGYDSHPDNRVVKLVVCPCKTVGLRYHGPHVFYYCRGVAVGEDRRPVLGPLREPATAAVLRINHYYSRSMAELARKRARPNAADGQVRDTAQVPADEVQDEAILQFMPALRKAFDDRMPCR